MQLLRTRFEFLRLIGCAGCFGAERMNRVLRDKRKEEQVKDKKYEKQNRMRWARRRRKVKWE